MTCAVLVLTGCGQESPDASSAESPPTSPSDPGGSSGSAAAVTALTVRQVGGLTGLDETSTVTADVAASGELFAMAAMLPPPARGGLEQAPCCDRVTYLVRVDHGDGVTRYTTWDGAGGPVHELAMAVLEVAGRG